MTVEERKQYQKEWHKKNRERVCSKALSRYHTKPGVKDAQRRRQIVNQYGITPEDYEDLLCEQDARCAICGKKFNRTVGRDAPCIDHNHDTGAVRGLLCRECNAGLGWLERPGFLEGATAYLKR